MSEKRERRGGFSYFVSEEQLREFSRLTDLERLQWVDEARLFTLLGRTPQTEKRQEQLRRGEKINFE